MFDFAGTGALWAKIAPGYAALESEQYCEAIDRPTEQVINVLPETHVQTIRDTADAVRSILNQTKILEWPLYIAQAHLRG